MRSVSGINLLDVKKRNRASVLNLIYHGRNISRKEIAARLGLTPAAITLIVNDLLQEGILEEGDAERGTSRKGRREVSLDIKRSKYIAVGIHISRDRFCILCADLNRKSIFTETVSSVDCRGKSSLLLDKIATATEESLKSRGILDDHTLIGIGVSIKGIVDQAHGISMHSYHIIEDNVNVAEYLKDRLGVPVTVTNNISALAYAENILSDESAGENILLIKYGPGVGAARFSRRSFLHYNNYPAIQLGHLIMDDNGEPCICGNRGCLETIVSYDAIEKSLSKVIDEVNAPCLWSLVNGDTRNLTMDKIFEAYSAGDAAVTKEMERVIHYLALAINNAICLLAPQEIILYDEPFENARFKNALLEKLSQYTSVDNVTVSRFNTKLDALGPVAVAISSFFDSGGQHL